MNPSEPPLITPTWARLLTLPAVIAFICTGVGIISVGFVAASREKEMATVLISLNLVLGGFFLYVALRGLQLLQYKMTRAEICDGQLWIKKNRHSSLKSYSLDTLKVVDHRTMQIVDVIDPESGHKLFATDYWYPVGMKIAAAILAETTGAASMNTHTSAN